MEVIAAAEVTIVEIVFEIDTEADPAVLTTTEAEAEPQGAAQIGAAAIVVEGVAAASEQCGKAL